MKTQIDKLEVYETRVWFYRRGSKYGAFWRSWEPTPSSLTRVWRWMTQNAWTEEWRHTYGGANVGLERRDS